MFMKGEKSCDQSLFVLHDAYTMKPLTITSAYLHSYYIISYIKCAELLLV